MPVVVFSINNFAFTITTSYTYIIVLVTVQCFIILAWLSANKDECENGTVQVLPRCLIFLMKIWDIHLSKNDEDLNFVEVFR